MPAVVFILKPTASERTVLCQLIGGRLILQDACMQSHAMHINMLCMYAYHSYMPCIVYCILYCIVLYCIVLYCIVLYCIALYCIVFKYLYSPPQLPWANRGAFVSISYMYKKKDKF